MNSNECKEGYNRITIVYFSEKDDSVFLKESYGEFTGDLLDIGEGGIYLNCALNKIGCSGFKLLKLETSLIGDNIGYIAHVNPKETSIMDYFTPQEKSIFVKFTVKEALDLQNIEINTLKIITAIDMKETQHEQMNSIEPLW